MNDGGYLYSSGSINRLSDCIKQKGSAGRESERRFNMAIAVSENGRIFTIHTASTTYQMMADKYGVLLHLYYGRRSEGTMDYLLTYHDRGYCANIYDAGEDRTYSLDFLPQEFPVSGTGDTRSTALNL